MKLVPGKLYELTERGKYVFSLSPMYDPLKDSLFMLVKEERFKGYDQPRLTLLNPNGHNMKIYESAFEVHFIPAKKSKNKKRV